jgi:hypothetical protein
MGADDLERQVRSDTERFLGAATGHLPDDLSMSRLVDITLLITGPSSRHHLVNEGGWIRDEWRTWALKAMQHLRGGARSDDAQTSGHMLIGRVRGQGQHH